MVSLASARRVEVRNSFTEKWENCIVSEPQVLTTASKLEQVDSTAPNGSSGRQSARYVGVGPASKSNARISASSLTRSGRDATATHWKIRCANFQFALSMSCNVRSYVPSRFTGNSSKACLIRAGRQPRRNSNWQKIQRNLCYRCEQT